MNRFFFSILIVFLFSSCADKYLSYKSNYTFKSQDSKPDYSQLDYWAAHPWKWDPSDSIPKPLRNQERDSLVDVFFLHPTTLTSKKQKEISNAAIDDDYINGKTDYSTILFQASVFNQQCRVFAPRYRQAHINNFYSTDKQKAALAFELAYQDLKTAFEYYLQHWNNGRPIIIAGHSQGSFLAERLLKEFFDGKPLQNKLVTAYIIGWPLPENYFSSIKICADSLQTGCACSWRTFRNGYVPPYLKNEKEPVLVTNPLNWTSSNTYAPKQVHKGSVLTNFNKIYKHTTDAQISNGLLYVKKPKFPGGFLYRSKNYHIADINLFYVNMQEDIKRRIGLFWKG
jgi:Protein of unknown function (DUF3089)